MRRPLCTVRPTASWPTRSSRCKRVRNVSSVDLALARSYSGYEPDERRHVMGKIVVYLNITLDGVVQAPGAPEEDKRGGFQHGGWAAPYADAVQARKAGESMATTGALLLGRRT